MDALTLARLQFGTAIIYHFFFVPLTLGLGLLIAIMETLYVCSGKPVYKRMARFWGKLFLINFAMGVVTGIVQEFQFGMNWSSYSRFVGDIFGAPLALEALLAFFMESTFLGIWVFGWDQLPKKLHLAMIWGVVFASHLSAFWILVANSFMQEPTGFVIHDGRAQMTDFFALLKNPHVWLQVPHVVMAGLVTGAFFVVGISAYHLLKRSGDLDFFRRSVRMGIIAALIGSILVMVVGDLQMKSLFQTQPMKAASAEALWNSEDPAPLSLFSIIDEKDKQNTFSIRIPNLLSFLAYDSLDGKVEGINQLQAQYEQQYGQGNYVPPVVVTFWGFRVMVGSGLLLAALSMLGLFMLWRKRLEQKRWLLWGLLAATVVPYIANSAGWILTEMGRQPWLVFGLLKTADGVSPNVTPAMILTSLLVFVGVYGALAGVDVYLLAKHSKEDTPETPIAPERIAIAVPTGPLPPA
ncbi:cytochrome ubiquinol oxidase subunit I [Ktedonosporobacter rubrisoli]|uniref:Cytochrome ubiquinol oxidase subunit I n=1 Tax=Ktedonosporobacter rubrisoli TaxID=2509675 RepID=A0A4P6JTU9_KTERU|nr:cytochrome ubiquinol oxidase subunit I [Ktedonosporobacter rubrisoli]QBD78765.1 cytochrome ubiquinol oxidase subunit I [Ktedonosporobacter rubrisoli]